MVSNPAPAVLGRVSGTTRYRGILAGAPEPVARPGGVHVGGWGVADAPSGAIAVGRERNTMNPILTKLGYNAHDRVVIVHADDMGMCPCFDSRA
jgi:hypothetical protein